MIQSNWKECWNAVWVLTKRRRDERKQHNRKRRVDVAGQRLEMEEIVAMKAAARTEKQADVPA